jgi:hypothetical protein
MNRTVRFFYLSNRTKVRCQGVKKLMTTFAKEVVISCLIEMINKDCKARTLQRGFLSKYPLLCYGPGGNKDWIRIDIGYSSLVRQTASMLNKRLKKKDV